jgi:hypothetical protein
MRSLLMSSYPPFPFRLRLVIFALLLSGSAGQFFSGLGWVWVSPNVGEVSTPKLEEGGSSGFREFIQVLWRGVRQNSAFLLSSTQEERPWSERTNDASPEEGREWEPGARRGSSIASPPSSQAEGRPWK